MINYCTVCGGELRIPVSEKKEQHQCPTCGVSNQGHKKAFA